ncbi:hypothetical protein BsWGS_06774 [Bradybaena similaris]
MEARFSNTEDRTRGGLSRRDHWPEVPGDKFHGKHDGQRQGLYRNNSMPYLRQPVKEDEESSRLVCRWQAQNRNQVEPYRQQGVRCRSNSNNYDQILSCRRYRKHSDSETPRGHAGYSRKTRGEILRKCHEPDVYVCDNYEAVDCSRKQPKTTVYLCDVPKYNHGRASPKRTKQPRYTIGCTRDIAPQYEHHTKYNIRAPALPPEKCFRDVVCTSAAGKALTFRCARYKRVQEKGILTRLAQSIVNFLTGLIRFILLGAVCLLVLYALLVFINLNTFGHYSVLALIFLFLHMLIMQPDDLWIHYYIK